MNKIASHVNLFDDCLRLVVFKGWEISFEVGLDFEETYSATKDEFSLCADNPIELLGLVTLAENARFDKNDPWWGFVPGDDDIWNNLLKKGDYP